MQPFQLDISDLIEIYNHAPQILQKQAIKVSLTENSLIHKSNEPIILTSAKNGNYWIIATTEEDYWLFPKDNIKIDNFNLETFKCLFNFDNYHLQVASLLTLIKPAKISLMPNGREWKLEKLGKIAFIESSSSIDLKTQLELANQEITQLQLKLNEITKKSYLLQENLNQLHPELQRERQERQQLLSLIETKLNQQGNEISYIKNYVAEIKNQNLSATSKVDIPDSLILTIKKFLHDTRILIFTEINQHNLTYHNQKKEEVKTYYKQLVSIIKEFENKQSDTSPEHSIYNPKLHYIPSWLKSYNQNPESFEKYQHIPVSITDESVHQCRLGCSQPIILEYNKKGNYWIFSDNNNGSLELCLVPKANLKINEYGLETVKFLFEVLEENFGNYTKIKVIFPAILMSVQDEKWQWQLKSLGKLEFETD
ncbi:hypothetical protein H6G36_03655 [Anabaena minutissima FACHB-250]|nr:hypothetical protein [Anabaena minutissima FACHB-250]